MLKSASFLAAPAAAAIVFLGGCDGGSPPREGASREAPEPSGTARTRRGTYEVSWRPVGGSVPLNEPFDVAVALTRADGSGEPVAGADVYVRCDMPAHGHGMNVEPRAVELGNGLYRVEGLLLHMTGHWTVGIDVVVDGAAETADFELTLE